MSGTNIEQTASDQSSPFVLNKRNWMYQAPHATNPANNIRPAFESGVVFGSEIMKNVKRSSAPLCSRWIGMAIGSPRYTDRPNSSTQ